jgi:hypothetical protein
MTKCLTLMVNLLFSTGLLLVAKQDRTAQEIQFWGVLLREGYFTKSIKCQDESISRDLSKRVLYASEQLRR